LIDNKDQATSKASRNANLEVYPKRENLGGKLQERVSGLMTSHSKGNGLCAPRILRSLPPDVSPCSANSGSAPIRTDIVAGGQRQDTLSTERTPFQTKGTTPTPVARASKWLAARAEV